MLPSTDTNTTASVPGVVVDVGAEVVGGAAVVGVLLSVDELLQPESAPAPPPPGAARITARGRRRGITGQRRDRAESWGKRPAGTTGRRDGPVSRQTDPMPKVLVDVTPLRESREFRLLYFGQIISYLGSQMTVVAAPYQVYVLTHSSLMVGLLGLAAVVPADRRLARSAARWPTPTTGASCCWWPRCCWARPAWAWPSTPCCPSRRCG